MISQIVNKKTSELIPYINNAKLHEDSQVKLIAASINEFGFNNPILTDGRNGIVAGHGRLLAAEKLGLDEVPCIELSHLSDVQKKAYILADNRLGEIGGGWDMDSVRLELETLDDMEFDISLTGFELDLEEKAEGLTDPDEVPEVDEEKEPVSKLGMVWLCGDHRVMCGDSTSEEDVAKLMDGKKADMVFTDPPYNTGMKPQDSGEHMAKPRLSHMFNDDYSDDEWQSFMESFCGTYNRILKENTGAYICLDWRRNHELIPHIKNNFKLSNVIIWDKVVHGLGSDYKYTYEVINVCKKGNPEMDTHQGDREYSDVWHIQREMGRNKDHATAKPVVLVERCLRHASKPNSIVTDLFLGSGTTLIACESLNRFSYGMEMMPNYCDVIVKRWQDYTGKEATLENDGRTFNEIASMLDDAKRQEV